jgi:hypothetical protein
MVLIGPTCPVEQADSPCPDRPFEADIDIVDERGDLITTVRSGADGLFEVELRPSTYTLRPKSGSTPPTATEQVVVVQAGAFTDVTVSYDSGIR